MNIHNPMPKAALSAAAFLAMSAMLCSCGVTNSGESMSSNSAVASKMPQTSSYTAAVGKDLYKRPDSALLSKNDEPEIAFIGNSLTFYNDTHLTFRQMLMKQGKSPVIQPYLESGYRVEQHISDMESGKNNMEQILPECDAVIINEYGREFSDESVNKIVEKCGKNTQICIFLTHYNTEFYPFTAQIHFKKLGVDSELVDDSVLDLAKKYMNGKASANEFSNNFLESCQKSKYSSDRVCYIPAGYVFDELVYKYGVDENLLLADEYLHPTEALSYINAMTFYYCLYGELPEDNSELEYCITDEFPKDFVKTVEKIIPETIESYYKGELPEQKLAEFSAVAQ